MLPATSVCESVSCVQPMDDKVADIRKQITALSKGVIVNATDTKSCDESSNLVILKLTSYTDIENIPVFSDIKLKIPKSLVGKIKKLLGDIVTDF